MIDTCMFNLINASLSQIKHGTKKFQFFKVQKSLEGSRQLVTYGTGLHVNKSVPQVNLSPFMVIY